VTQLGEGQIQFQGVVMFEYTCAGCGHALQLQIEVVAGPWKVLDLHYLQVMLSKFWPLYRNQTKFSYIIYINGD
jgi:hypothetical protein